MNPDGLIGPVGPVGPVGPDGPVGPVGPAGGGSPAGDRILTLDIQLLHLRLDGRGSVLRPLSSSSSSLCPRLQGLLMWVRIRVWAARVRGAPGSGLGHMTVTHREQKKSSLRKLVRQLDFLSLT